VPPRNAAFAAQPGRTRPAPDRPNLSPPALRGVTGDAVLKAHLSVDPDSELIDEIILTPANTPDKFALPGLVESLKGQDDLPEIVGDAAYGDGATRAELKDAGISVIAKVPPARNMTGGFSKDRFSVDLDNKMVTCPAHQSVPIRFSPHGGGTANFAPHCSTCPLATQCTTSRNGRSITINKFEGLIQQARSEQTEPDWKARYKADRPMVERKISHFVRRPWGGRNARTRGLKRVGTDVDTRAAAINLARLAVLGLTCGPNGWAVAGA